MKHFKVFVKDLLHQQNNTNVFTALFFFIRINKRLTGFTTLIKSVVVLEIHKVSEPTEILEQYFRRYAATQIGHVIDENAKDIYFIKQLTCKFFVMYLSQKVRKRCFIRLHFSSILSNSSLLNVPRLFINLKIFIKIRAFRRYIKTIYVFLDY